MGSQKEGESQPLFRLSPISDLSRKADPDTQQFTAAKYYRLAEDNGNKIIGNSW